MKKEKGVTLVSLIMYIILMTFIIAIAARLTSALYYNLNEIDKGTEEAVDMARFNMYFLKDIKNDNIYVAESSENYIKFKNTVNSQEITYSVSDGTLYRNKVKICDKVTDISIAAGTTSITIGLKIGNYSKVTTYAIEKHKITYNN